MGLLGLITQCNVCGFQRIVYSIGLLGLCSAMFAAFKVFYDYTIQIIVP
jgi:hypothetical protein